MQSILHANDVRSGDCNDMTRVLHQKVHNYKSDRWIALIFFQEFREAVFHGEALYRFSTRTTSGRAIAPTRPEYWHKMSITIDPTVVSL